MKQTTAQSLDGEFKLVHAVPGRVRLRSTDNRAISTLEKVAKQLRQQHGICEVQTNPVTNSLVITFDENAVSLPQTLERLQTSAKLSEASTKSQPSPELTLDSLLK